MNKSTLARSTFTALATVLLMSLSLPSWAGALGCADPLLDYDDDDVDIVVIGPGTA